MQAIGDKRPIVVGVDGSAESHAALEWAIEFASTRSAPLKLVTAFQVSGATHRKHGGVPADVVAGLQARTKALAGMTARLNESGVDYQHVVVQDAIAPLVEDHAEGAQMVVLGSASRRRFHQRLRPSLARRLTGRIDCPVMSIPVNSVPTTATASTGPSSHAIAGADSHHDRHSLAGAAN